MSSECTPLLIPPLKRQASPDSVVTCVLSVLSLNICPHHQGNDAVRVAREDSSGTVVLILALALFCADQPAVAEDLHFQIAYRRHVSTVRSGALRTVVHHHCCTPPRRPTQNGRSLISLRAGSSA